MPVTAEALISSAQRRAYMPGAGMGAFATADWLQMLNEQLFEYVVPFVTKRRKHYWLDSLDVPLVSGTARYVIPHRSAGARFYAIQLLDAQGNPATQMLTPLEPQEALAWPTSVLASGQPLQYSVVGNSILLSPTPSVPFSTPTMRVYYYRRPSTLVLVSGVQEVATYEQVSGTTFRAKTDANSIFAVGAQVELVRGVSGFETDGPYVVVSTDDDGGSTDVLGTIPATALARDTSAGLPADSISLVETANVVTYMPEDWAWWLAQATAVEAIASRGDDSKLARAQLKLERAEASVDSQLNQRDVAGRHKMMNAQRTMSFRRPPFFVR